MAMFPQDRDLLCPPLPSLKPYARPNDGMDYHDDETCYVDT